MSLSRKRVTVLAVLAVTLVSLLTATINYTIPDSTHVEFVFVLGFETRKNYVVEESTLIELILRYSNGSSTTIREGVQMTSTSDPYFMQIEGQLNSTDIQEIKLAQNTQNTAMHIPSGFNILVAYCIQNYTIHAYLTGEESQDLGVLNVTNAAFQGITTNVLQENVSLQKYYFTSDVPRLQWSSTGYWNDFDYLPPNHSPGGWSMPMWHINGSQIHDILVNASDPITINFNMDTSLQINVRLITTSLDETTYSDTLKCSGTCATLQLLHEGDTLTGLRYTISPIILDMMPT